MNTSQSLYSRLGGETVLREFVDNLYRFMDDFPAVEKVRNMHPYDLTDTEDRLFKYLSGMLGGPPLYIEEFWQPYVKQDYTHTHLAMCNQERDQWLFCAENAANQLKIDSFIRKDLMSMVTAMTSDFRNNEEMLSKANGWKSAAVN